MEVRRVLIIDDSALIRKLAKMSLEKRGGWSVYTAGSGQEGLALAEKEQPTAIVLDVIMPIMDGLATYKELRARESTRDIPVVFLTGKEDSLEIQELAKLGATRVLSKPFDAVKFPAKLAGLLGWS